MEVVAHKTRYHCELGPSSTKRWINGLQLGSYRCVVVDPPWTWATYSEAGLDGRPQHYDRMSDRQIAELPIKSLLDPAGAWVFLWSTSPKAPFALTLAESWGLRFSGRAFSWVKLNRNGTPFMGLGLTTRKNLEDCWLLRTGKPERLARDVCEVVMAPRREHSRKPVEVMERIERFCPGPRLELFAREKRLGWDSWGRETDKFTAEDCNEAVGI